MNSVTDDIGLHVACCMLHVAWQHCDSFTGTRRSSTPPHHPCPLCPYPLNSSFPLCPPPFLFLFPSEVSEENSYSMALSLPQPHNVGYVMAVTPLLLAHSQDIRASSPAKAVRGHTVENVSVCNKTSARLYVCEDDCHTWVPPLVGVCTAPPTAETPSSWCYRAEKASCETFHSPPPLWPAFPVLTSLSSPRLLACLPFSPVPPPPRLHTPMLSSSISQHSIYCCSIHLGWSPGSSPPRPRLVDSLWVSWRTTFHYQSDMAQPRTPLLLSSLGHDGPEPDRHLWGWISHFEIYWNWTIII